MSYKELANEGNEIIMTSYSVSTSGSDESRLIEAYERSLNRRSGRKVAHRGSEYDDMYAWREAFRSNPAHYKVVPELEYSSVVEEALAWIETKKAA